MGAGAFVSEIFGEEAEELRRHGGDKGEYGATTGRPRRMGWFDCIATRYGCKVQGATEAVVTVLDALSYLDNIPVCVGYELDGEISDNFPVTPDLERAKPVLKVLDGSKTSGASASLRSFPRRHRNTSISSSVPLTHLLQWFRTDPAARILFSGSRVCKRKGQR